MPQLFMQLPWTQGSESLKYIPAEDGTRVKGRIEVLAIREPRGLRYMTMP